MDYSFPISSTTHRSCAIKIATNLLRRSKILRVFWKKSKNWNSIKVLKTCHSNIQKCWFSAITCWPQTLEAQTRPQNVFFHQVYLKKPGKFDLKIFHRRCAVPQKIKTGKCQCFRSIAEGFLNLLMFRLAFQRYRPASYGWNSRSTFVSRAILTQRIVASWDRLCHADWVHSRLRSQCCMRSRFVLVLWVNGWRVGTSPLVRGGTVHGTPGHVSRVVFQIRWGECLMKAIGMQEGWKFGCFFVSPSRSLNLPLVRSRKWQSLARITLWLFDFYFVAFCYWPSVLFFSLKHFGHFFLGHLGHWNSHLPRRCIKTHHNSVFSPYFETFWPKWLIFFRSFQKHFVLYL